MIDTDILIASCLGNVGGIPNYSRALARSFDNQGYETKLLRKKSGNANYVDTYPHRTLRKLEHFVAPHYLSKAIKQYSTKILHFDYVDGATAHKWSKTHRDTPVIVTAHDAIPFFYPHENNLANSFYRYHMGNTIMHADRVIVVSQQSKDDLIKFTNIPEQEIEVVYNGIDHQSFKPRAEKPKNNVFTIRYVGGLTAPHKNVQTILETAKLLQDRKVEVSFEIAGGAKPDMPVFKSIDQLGVNNVKLVGFVADNELRDFYSGADLFIYPSLYEGFGFPPLEAMACGVPVLSSSFGSLGEVLGNAGVVTYPEPENFAYWIIKLINDRLKLESMAEDGIRQARKYSWEKAAQETLTIYDQLCPGLIKTKKPLERELMLSSLLVAS